MTIRTKMLVAVSAAVATAAGTGLLGVPSASAATPQFTYTPSPNWWTTNGRVTDSVVIGNRVYLSGGFDYIGPATGYGAATDATTGVKDSVTPLINGNVNAVVPDGSGGWFVGGAFNSVGGQVRKGVAQIDANGNVTKWNPKVKGTVYALAVSGSQVFIGGAITQVGSSSIQNVTAVDNNRGAIVSTVHASANGTVYALLANGSSVYAGGSFGNADGIGHPNLVRYNATDGSVDTSFTGTANGTVQALTMSGDSSTLYAGGAFSQASGAGGTQNRTRLAAYATSGGSVTGWAPSADGTVLAMAADPASGDVYVGGQFSNVNGTPRTRLADVASSGSLQAFDANLSGCLVAQRTKNSHNNVVCTPEVDSLTVANGAVYVGGLFGYTGTTVRHDAAAFTLGTTTPTSWNPVPSSNVLALGVTATQSFVGGSMTSMGGLVRRGLAALNLTTGAGDPTFQADTDNIPLDLEPSTDQSMLYVVGNFSTIGGFARSDIAAIDTSTGLVDPNFKANANNDALVAKYANGSLYVGGQFLRINNQPAVHIAKLNGLTGALNTTFNVSTSGPSGPLRQNGMVQGLAVQQDGSRVYLGGPFNVVNGVSSPQGIAVVDGTTGALTPQQLGGVGQCGGGVGPWITYLYLSPDGQRLYGGDTCPDNIYQWNAVTLSSPSNPTGLIWQTWCNAGMQAALELNGEFFYGSHGGNKNAGGYCWTSPSNHTQVFHQRFTVFDQTTGAIEPDTVTFDSPMGVWSITKLPQGLLVGGDFTFVGDSTQVRQGLAMFPNA